MSLLPHSRRGAVWRFLIAAVVVVLFAATATAVAGLLQFKQFARELAVTPALKNARITVADAGAPQTLLLIGSDHRAGTSWKTSNTDTMMLVRLDAGSSTINVLSIPRDLEVQLPQGNVMTSERINAAYSRGGPNLLVRTLEQQVFRGLHINHIIDVNFGGFSALVDAIGCVYADVDRRYFHVSAPDAADNWSSIDIQPGYQKLCGRDALEFVRFRHLDSDLVREARQQAFLRWAKSGFSTGSLVGQRDHLISVFGAHTQTDSDLHSIDGLINLFNLVAFSAGHTVRQVAFPGTPGPCDPTNHPQSPCYVVSNAPAEARAFASFMRPTAMQPASHKTSGSHKPAPPSSSPAPPAPLVDATIADGGQAHSLAAYRLGMPVYLPTKIAPGSAYCADGTCSQGPVHNSYPRAYTLHEPNGRPHAAYRATLVINPVLGQYYGIQGTTWKSPPILTGTHDTRVVAGKTLQIYRQGSKIVMVAWRTPGAVYWISNTLTSDLSNAQIVAIAASLKRM